MTRKLICSFLLLTSLVLSACTGFFETDNTPEPSPLTQYTPRLKPQLRWSAHLSGSRSEDYLRQSPVIDNDVIYVANTAGFVGAYALSNGKSRWASNTGVAITSGVGAKDGLVVVGGRYGEVIALEQSNGRLVWRNQVKGEILAAPAVTNRKILIKTVAGQVYAFAANDGHQLWTYKQNEPNLILRGASSPLIKGDYAYIGFANGNLAKVDLTNGHAAWQQRIAIPQGAFGIDRMIDIDADPIIFQDHLYAATYQGKIAAISQRTGDIRWHSNISSYTGMTADADHVYISDSQGLLWSFNTSDGEKSWQQNDLKARILTAPAMQQGYLVVGDAQGFLHWLNKNNGTLLARQHIGPMYANPVVKDGVLYALTNNGSLYAFTIHGLDSQAPL